MNSLRGRVRFFYESRPLRARSGSAFWLWMAADNLRLSARNATACALELVQLKPTNRVQ